MDVLRVNKVTFRSENQIEFYFIRFRQPTAILKNNHKFKLHFIVLV